jgi:hypothetical protein
VTKLSELRDELRTVFAGKGPGLLDAALPVIIYLLVSRLINLETGIWSALGISILFLVFRVIQGQSVVYSLVGLAGAALPAGSAYLSGGESGFFLPGLVTGSLTVVLLVGSLLVKRPLAAYSSHLTRKWPLDWYWHTKIRPAYSEVTLFWAIGFGARLGLEYWLFTAGKTISLGLVKTLLGWPYTILILILSYLYGIWRLGQLAGPSVDEFIAGSTEPWQGQQRGF